MQKTNMEKSTMPDVILAVWNKNPPRRDVRKLKSVPFFEMGKTSAQMLVPPEYTTIFDALIFASNLQKSVTVEDISTLLATETISVPGSRPFSWTSYHDIDDINAYLHNMSTTYPDWANLAYGGRSYENRDILGLRINTPNGHLNKSRVFVESGIHAREWITVATTLYFIKELLTSKNPKIIALRDQIDWHIFPSVNPDGYHYSFNWERFWRKTRSLSPNGCYGVDANRNWDFDWMTFSSSSDPCDYQIYAGTKPFSEIETRTLSQYVANIENLECYISNHADAQMLLIPHSNSVAHVANRRDLEIVGNKSLEYGKAVNGATYAGPDTAAAILYPVSGDSSDWAYSTFHLPLTFSYELRGIFPGTFISPSYMIPELGDEYTQMIVGLVEGGISLGYFQ